MDAGHIKVPSIAMLVRVANIPPAGVNPPYMNDWKAAAIVPKVTQDWLVIDWASMAVRTGGNRSRTCNDTNRSEAQG